MDATSDTNVPLPDEPSLCHEIIRQQSASLAQCQQRIAKLEHQLEQLLKRQYGPRRELVDPNQLLLFDVHGSVEASDANDAAAEPPSSETVVREHKRRGGGRRPLPKELPRERIEHDLPDEQKACPCCGVERVRIGEEVSEQLDFVPASLKVIEHVRYKYACQRCQEHVAIAPPPIKPIPKGVAGAGLLAQLVVSKYSDHLPLYRLEDILFRQGVEIGRATLCRWAAQTASLLEPLYDVMVERVLLSQVIWTDDTPVSVLDSQLPRTRTGRFWVYCGDAANPYSVYDYTPTHERDGPASFLENYQGYLQADAFSGYDGIYAGSEVTQVSCWAHARRKFYEARTTKPTEAHTALAYVQRLYQIERRAKTLNDDDRLSRRQEHALPMLADFRAWLESTQPTVLPKSPMGEAIAYVLKRWESFLRYCEAGFLSIDNNLAERMLRPCAVGRRNWLFLGSDNGGKTAAILFSFMASCKANSVEPFAYLRDIIDRLAVLSQTADASGPPTTSLYDLLPDAWLRQHPEAHRPWAR